MIRNIRLRNSKGANQEYTTRRHKMKTSKTENTTHRTKQLYKPNGTHQKPDQRGMKTNLHKRAKIYCHLKY